MPPKRKIKDTSITEPKKIQKISHMKSKDMNVSSIDSLVNPTSLGSVVLNPSEDVKKRIRDKEEEIEELKMDIKKVKAKC